MRLEISPDLETSKANSVIVHTAVAEIAVRCLLTSDGPRLGLHSQMVPAGHSYQTAALAGDGAHWPE